MASELLDTIQAISIAVGVVVSIVSFNYTRAKEAVARQLDAAKPFLELRQKLYTEAVAVAGVLANPGTHSAEEREKALKRFHQLYVTELTMVESPKVEAAMRTMAKALGDEVTKLTPPQEAAYNLAHAARDSFIGSWSGRDI